MNRRLSYLFFFGLCYLFKGPAEAQTAETIIEKTEKMYLAASTITAEFRLEIHWQFRDSSEQKPGRLYFQRPEKYRLELGAALFLTDGETFWRYSPQTRQVLVSNIRDAGGEFDPRQWFFKYSEKYKPTSLVTAQLDGRKCFGVTLTPKDNAPFNKLVVWIDSETGLTKKLETTDKNENTAVYYIDRLALDKPIDKKRFAFSPPLGAEVVDLRE